LFLFFLLFFRSSPAVVVNDNIDAHNDDFMDFIDDFGEIIELTATQVMDILNKEFRCSVTKDMIMCQVENNLSSDGKVSIKIVTDLLEVFDKDATRNMMALEDVPDFCDSFIAEISRGGQQQEVNITPSNSVTWCPNLADLDAEHDDFELSAAQRKQQLIYVVNGMHTAPYFNVEAKLFNMLVISTTVDFGGYLPWYHLYYSKSNVETYLKTFTPLSIPAHWDFATILVNELHSRLKEYNLFHHSLIDVTSGHDSLYKSVLVSIYLTQWFQRENARRAANSDLTSPMSCLQLKRATMYFIMKQAFCVVNGLCITFLELFRRTHCVNNSDFTTSYMSKHSYNLDVKQDLEERLIMRGRLTTYNTKITAAWRLMRPHGSRTKTTPQNEVIEAMELLETHKQIVLASQQAVFKDLMKVCIEGFADEQQVGAATTAATDLHIAAVAEVVKCVTIDCFSMESGKWAVWNSPQKDRHMLMTAPQQLSVSILHTTMPNHRQYFGSVDVSNANMSLSLSPEHQEYCTKMSGLYEYQEIDITNEKIIMNIKANATAARQVESDKTNFVDFVPFE
jgi:hypothetical protein